MAIHSLEDLILEALRADLGWAIHPQIRDVIDDPSKIVDQNPNAIADGIRWLSGVSTGCSEVDEKAAEMQAILEQASADASEE